MKREILFRGKDCRTLKWWYGSLAYFPDSQSAHIIPCGTCKIDKVVCNYVEVNQETIGMFTGLKDSHRTDIYEGDLLKDDEITFEVFWCDDVAAFMVEQYNSECDAPKMFLLSDVVNESEVIGNIHDNQ